jgi:hypothetical protein
VLKDIIDNKKVGMKEMATTDTMPLKAKQLLNIRLISHISPKSRIRDKTGIGGRSGSTKKRTRSKGGSESSESEGGDKVREEYSRMRQERMEKATTRTKRLSRTKQLITSHRVDTG